MHLLKYILSCVLISVAGLATTATAASPEEFGLGYQVNDPAEFEAVNDINVGGVEDHKDDKLLDVVKSVINRVLGILALICLLLALYGGFLMVTSAGDEKNYSQGRKILKSALIGILIIGVARFIVSLIFRITQQINRAAEGSTAGTDQ